MLPPPPWVVQVAQDGPRGQKGVIEVDGEQLLPVGEFELLQRRHDLDPGIAHQDVDAPEGLGRGGDPSFDLAFTAHVHRDAQRPSVGRGQLGGCRFGRGRIEIGDHDLRALAGESAGDLLADAARGAGDDGDFVLQAHDALLRSGEIIVNHFAEAEREVGHDVGRGYNLEHRQLGEGRQRVRTQLERAGSDPGALHLDIGEVVLDQLANAWAAVDMRDDFEQVIRRLERGTHRRQVGRLKFSALL